MPLETKKEPVKKRKSYAKVQCKASGKWVLLHRQLMAERLGRPLLPGEIVHHRDGDSTNNEPENLVVLPSQRYHAHMEYHLRRERLGMSSLFPELFLGMDEVGAAHDKRRGTLFAHLPTLGTGPS